MPTLKSYIWGFALSVGLTLAPAALFWLHGYMHHRFPTHQELGALFVALAVLQLGVQLIFFLHVGTKRKTHWRVVTLGLTLFIVIVVVGGTLWIMNNLQDMAAQSTPFTNNHITAHDEQD